MKKGCVSILTQPLFFYLNYSISSEVYMELDILFYLNLNRSLNVTLEIKG